jgi:hypothetical protein
MGRDVHACIHHTHAGTAPDSRTVISGEIGRRLRTGDDVVRFNGVPGPGQADLDDRGACAAPRTTQSTSRSTNDALCSPHCSSTTARLSTHLHFAATQHRVATTAAPPVAAHGRSTPSGYRLQRRGALCWAATRQDDKEANRNATCRRNGVGKGAVRWCMFGHAPHQRCCCYWLLTPPSRPLQHPT